MVGRAAQGAPWVFGQIAAFFESGELIADPDLDQMHQILLGHLQALYAHYGEYSGCRIARKHIAWYTGGLPDSNRFRAAMYELESTASQFQFVDEFFEGLSVSADWWAAQTSSLTDVLAVKQLKVKDNPITSLYV